MENQRPLESISDDELLRRLSEILRQSRHVEAELVAHIAEVDERKLYAREATPSMFAYCTEVLHLSDAEAYLRIAAARASREHPRSKRQIEELVAELAPRPDVPAAMRKLPENGGGLAIRFGANAGSPSAGLRPDAVAGPTFGPAVAPAPRAVVQPLAPARYKVVFTASAELRDKLERLQALMRPQVPDGDLAAVIEQAVTEKLQRIEARRFARTAAPRKVLRETDVSPTSRRIPAAVRRAVTERDGNRCRYVDDQGRRCSGRDRLEFHHRHPFGLGGDHSPESICLMCHAHNTYLAEHDYGKAAMARQWRSGNRTSESSAGDNRRSIAPMVTPTRST